MTQTYLNIKPTFLLKLICHSMHVAIFSILIISCSRTKSSMETVQLYINETKDSIIIEKDNSTIKPFSYSSYHIDLNYDSLNIMNLRSLVSTPIIEKKLKESQIEYIFKNLKEDYQRKSLQSALINNEIKLNSKQLIENIITFDNNQDKRINSDSIKIQLLYVEKDKKKFIENYIYNLQSIKNDDYSYLLSIYTELATEKELLQILKHIISIIDENKYISADYKRTPVFIALLNSESEDIVSEVKKIIFEYLDKGNTYTLIYPGLLIKDMFYEEWKQFYKKKINSLLNNLNEEKSIKKFNYNYLNIFGITHGFDAFEYIKQLLIITNDEYKIVTINNVETKRILQRSREVEVEKAMEAINILTKSSDLTNEQKKIIYDFIVSENVQYCTDQTLRHYVSTLKNLYPDKDYTKEPNVIDTQRISSSIYNFEYLWNRDNYSITSIKNYISYLDNLGLNTKGFSNTDKLEFILENYQIENKFLMYNLIVKLNYGLKIEPEIGSSYIDYKEIASNYLKLCSKDLSNYEITSKFIEEPDKQPFFNLSIYHNNVRYSTKIIQNGDWLNHFHLVTFVNYILEDYNVKNKIYNLCLEGPIILIYTTNQVLAKLRNISNKGYAM